jgi:dihydrofolate reductase
MSGELSEVVAKLRTEPGNDIIMDGGSSLVREFIQCGLTGD